jgi:hypothetical protein
MAHKLTTCIRRHEKHTQTYVFMILCQPDPLVVSRSHVKHECRREVRHDKQVLYSSAYKYTLLSGAWSYAPLDGRDSSFYPFIQLDYSPLRISLRTFTITRTEHRAAYSNTVGDTELHFQLHYRVETGNRSQISEMTQ